MSAPALNQQVTVPRLVRISAVPQVADAVREGLARGVFPEGTRLTEQLLAEQLGVSRGPLREALQRLVQEGLLVSRPNRGVFVPSLGSEDVHDIYLARFAVERTAAAVVGRAPRTETVARLAEIVSDMRSDARAGKRAPQRLSDHDLRFHQCFVQAAGSLRLNRLYKTLASETRILLGRVDAAYLDLDALVWEHESIVDALAAQDPAQLIGRVEAHLQWSLSALPAGLLKADFLERPESPAKE